MVDARDGRAHNLAVLERALTRSGEADGAVGADALTGMAADAMLGIDARLARGMLLHLARAAAAAHADVLHAAAKARALVALEVREADYDVGVHERMADLCLLHVLAVLDGNNRLVGALEAVGDNHLAAGGVRSEAVLVGAVDVLERVFATAHVERVAVGEERLAAQLLDHVRDGTRVVGAQEGEVAQFAEVDLDGDELVVEVDLLDAGAANQALELVELAFAAVRAQVGEVHLGRCSGCSCGHRYIPSVYMALQT